MPATKTTKAGGGSFPKRLSSALARTISRSSTTSNSSGSSSSGSTSGSNSSRTSSDDEERANPSKPAGDAPNPHPIPPVPHHATSSSVPSRRSSNDSLSIARTWNTLSTSLGLLSLSPRQGDFEQQYNEEKEREKVEKAKARQRAKQQKTVEKQISEFHSTIQGAVFVGTVRRASSIMERDTGGIKLFVDTIKPKHPPAKQSKKFIHFANFQQYYNDAEQHAPLQCFFDVFMKTPPAVGSRVTFIVKPTGEHGNYVAIACNLAKEKEAESIENELEARRYIYPGQITEGIQGCRLTHDSVSVRKAHNSGRNHLVNVKDYYAGMGNDKVQDFIDNVTAAIERSARAGPPGGPGGFGGPLRPFGNFGPPGPAPGPFGGPPRPMIGSAPGGPMPQFGGPPPQFGGSAPSFMPQQQPPQQFGAPQGGMMMPGGTPQQPGFPGSFPGSMPGQGLPQFGGQQPGGGMSPPPNQQSFSAPPSGMSPPQGIGMQINPQRAAALGLR